MSGPFLALFADGSRCLLPSKVLAKSSTLEDRSRMESRETKRLFQMWVGLFSRVVPFFWGSTKRRASHVITCKQEGQIRARIPPPPSPTFQTPQNPPKPPKTPSPPLPSPPALGAPSARTSAGALAASAGHLGGEDPRRVARATIRSMGDQRLGLTP